MPPVSLPVSCARLALELELQPGQGELAKDHAERAVLPTRARILAASVSGSRTHSPALSPWASAFFRPIWPPSLRADAASGLLPESPSQSG